MFHHSSSTTIKFLCSYAGRILPRYPDGRLRYHGGFTRLLSLHSSLSFSQLLMKMEELCGSPVTLIRCKLPTEDLDALVSITSDEDLANLIEEYNYAAESEELVKKPPQIRVFLAMRKSSPHPSSSSSSSSSSSGSSCSSDGSPPNYNYCVATPPRHPSSTGRRLIRKASIPSTTYPIVFRKGGGERIGYQYHNDGRRHGGVVGNGGVWH